MRKLIRFEHLCNGLALEFYDRSNRYFGDYHRVCVEVCCRVPVSSGAFGSAADLQEARTVLGEEVIYSRVMEKMGVPGEAVEAIREALIANYIRSAVSYLGAPGFPGKFIASEIARIRKKTPHWPRL